ncbi:MAG: FecR domain-containing protein [Deltaproteobacteria bacterium]|nr:FecR domain-containing protein [Deltaproteobacteria bacterium]
MLNDDIWKSMREQPVHWDEVRERRVLARILSSWGTARRRPVLWAAGIGTAVAGIALALAFGLSSAKIGLLPPAGGRSQETILPLADMGRAALGRGVRISPEPQADGSLRVVQSLGRVRYEVDHAQGRRMVVVADRVEITVVGTVFTVDAELTRVSIRVERGRVRVDDGPRALEIGAGEELAVALGGATTAPAKNKPPVPSRVESVRPAEPDAPRAISMGDMLARVDEARRRGALARAATLLEEAVRSHQDDPQTAVALFTLGNVERARGNHIRAAEAYRRCWSFAPNGPMAEDARAEAAASWAAAGRADLSSDDARRYLSIYPGGVHASRMRRLAE